MVDLRPNYQAYVAVFGIEGLTGRAEILKEIINKCPCSWHVIGVTPAAAKRFLKNGKKGIQRAHLYPRREAYAQLIDRATPASYEEFVKVVTRSAPCVLALKAENKHMENGSVGYTTFENDDYELFRNLPSGYRVTNVERALVASLTVR